MGNCEQGMPDLCLDAPYDNKYSSLSSAPTAVSKAPQTVSTIEKLAGSLNQFVYPQQYDDKLVRQLREFQLFDQAYYKGEWENGVPNGKGLFYKAGSWKYIGFVQNGKPHFYGRKVDIQAGVVYEGGFYQQQFNGQGRLMRTDGYRFQGVFALGEKVHGVQILNSGQKYVGSFISGKRHGDGELWLSAEQCYKGQFSQGLPHGVGELRSKDRVYAGQFSRGKKQGQGRQVYKDGSWYEGGFLRGFKHGKGEFQWAGGQNFKGEFKWDKQQGRGILRVGGEQMQVCYQQGKLLEN